MISEKLTVSVYRVKVSKKYFSFNYRFWRNGKLVTTATFDSSHSRAPATIKRLLSKGWGTELVLQREL